MEFGPIFRSLFQNRARTWLIVLEIGLTLAVVVNCLVLIRDQQAQIGRSTGMDEQNLIAVTSVPFDPAFQEEGYSVASYEQDLREIEAMPGVRSVTSILQFPLSGSGSATGRRIAGSEDQRTTVPYFLMGPDAIDTLGVELVQGRTFEPGDFPDLHDDDEEQAEEEEDTDHVTNILVTQYTADKFFPDGDALGKQIEGNNNNVDTIVGIVRLMHNSWPLGPDPENLMIHPSHPVNNRQTRYLVRTEPGRFDEVFVALEPKLREVEEGRIVTVRSLSEMKGNYYSSFTSMNQLLGWISVLLVAVTGLGIVGMTSFSVTQRTRHIGTRRALGATRGDIVRWFLVENWIMTGIGIAVGVALTFGLNYMLASMGGVPQIQPPILLVSILVMWLMGLLAALIPALRGSLVQPVIATRSV
ncbi:hypothetical protein ABI59_17385 [Acidobacteria bacterium Mor1]|nr:hypothetical protein ABI59_17385 [Acidobacteria bacterium Mor1]